MKKQLFLALAFVLTPIVLSAQADRILGTWITENGTSNVEIYKHSDGKYYGKIIWLKEPNENGRPRLDKENPDPKLAKRKLMGLPLLKNFSYNSSKHQYTDGKIYDPNNGKTYDCFAWFEGKNNNTLYLKGYVAGIKALGRKTTWRRK